MIVHDTFTIERTFDTSVARLYEAFADPEIKAKWFGGGDEWTPLERSIDFRVGGREIDHGRHVLRIHRLSPPHLADHRAEDHVHH